MELKIRVKSEEENREVQNLFFKLGGSWGFGGTRIRYESEKYLYLRDTTITYGESDWWFNENSCKEITISELRLMVENKELKEKIDSYESKIEAVEEEVLKTGVWYESNIDDCFVYRTGDYGNYGFFNEEYYEDLNCLTPNQWTEIEMGSEEHVKLKELFIKECKKRNIWNVPVIDCKGKVREWFGFGESFSMLENRVWSKYGRVWEDGVFAKPISKKLTLEERVERLEKLNNL